LAEGLSNPVVCKENRIRYIIPQELMNCRQALRQSLRRIQNACTETCRKSSGTIRPPECVLLSHAPYAGGTIMEFGYRIYIKAGPEAVWEPISRIGGQTGWYFANYMWQVRGAIDRLVGGIGLRKGRSHPLDLQKGDAIDFFRVLEVKAPHHLQLIAEIRFPGEATLEFIISPGKDGDTELQQISRYIPKGFSGLLYWYALYLFHQFVFKGMLRGIAKAVGKPVTKGPSRFTPVHLDVCSTRPGET